MDFDFKDWFSRLNMYHYILTFLVILIGINSYKFGFAVTIPQVLIALASCMVFDALIKYFKEKKLVFSKSARITGFFIGAVLGTGQLWYVPLIAALVAISSKYILKIQGKHIFNPASLGIILACIIFNTSTGWWAATSLYLVTLFGIILMIRMKSYYQIIPFLLSYVIIGYFTIPSFLTNISVGIIDATLLFFMFFMFVEPKTSPYNKNGRILYGLLIPILIFLVTKYVINYIPQVDPFLLALLMGNLTVPLIRKFIK